MLADGFAHDLVLRWMRPQLGGGQAPLGRKRAVDRVDRVRHARRRAVGVKTIGDPHRCSVMSEPMENVGLDPQSGGPVEGGHGRGVAPLVIPADLCLPSLDALVLVVTCPEGLGLVVDGERLYWSQTLSPRRCPPDVQRARIRAQHEHGPWARRRRRAGGHRLAKREDEYDAPS